MIDEIGMIAKIRARDIQYPVLPEIVGDTHRHGNEGGLDPAESEQPCFR